MALLFALGGNLLDPPAVVVEQAVLDELGIMHPLLATAIAVAAVGILS